MPRLYGYGADLEHSSSNNQHAPNPTVSAPQERVEIPRIPQQAPPLASPRGLLSSGEENVEKINAHGSQRKQRLAPLCRVSLLAIFILQVLVVAGAFAAVIVVLTEQQRKEFQLALYQQLSLQQESAMMQVAEPLLTKQKLFSHVVEHYINNPDTSSPKNQQCANSTSVAVHCEAGVNNYPRPSANDSDMQSMRHWLNAFYMFPRLDDPLVMSVAMVTERNISEVRSTYHMWFYETSFFANIQNESARCCTIPTPVAQEEMEVCNGPLQPYDPLAAVDNRTVFSLPLDTHAIWGGPDGFKARRVWGPPNWYLPANFGREFRFMSFTYTPNHTARPIVAFAISFRLTHTGPILSKSVAKPTSRSAIFYQYRRMEEGVTDYFLVAGVYDFPDRNPHADDSVRYNKGIWRGGKTPDRILNAAFYEGIHVSVNKTGTGVFEITKDGVRYTCAAARMYDIETDLDWLLIQYTPREEFFSASERSRNLGVAIGVVGAVIVLLSCILVWLSVRIPLQRLHEQMALSAEMRNEEASLLLIEGQRFLFLQEILELSNAFGQMNRKLLRARPFLPQSLLAPESSSTLSESDGIVVAPRDYRNVNDDANASEGNVVVINDMPQFFETERIRGGAASESSSVYIVREDGGSGERRRSRGGAYGQGHADDLSSMASVPGRAPQHAGRSTVLKRSMMMGRGLEHRFVGILSINVNGFHKASAMASSSEILLRWHTTLAKLICDCSGNERGVIDHFHGDHFVIGYNAARRCLDPSKAGARTAVRISDAFYGRVSSATESDRSAPSLPNGYPHHQHLSQELVGRSLNGAKIEFKRPTDGTSMPPFVDSSASAALRQFFPYGLSMGLAVGRAAVGNHGTETMRRLATVGSVYSESIRLQEVMARRVLAGGGGDDAAGGGVPGINARAVKCLVLGRVAKDIESSVLCQCVGAVEAAYFLSSIEHRSSRTARAFSALHNECMRPPRLASHAVVTSNDDNQNIQSTSVKCPADCSVLTYAIVAIANNRSDRWMNEQDAWLPVNPHAANNTCIARLWLEGVCVVPADASPPASSAPRNVVQFDLNACSEAGATPSLGKGLALAHPGSKQLVSAMKKKGAKGAGLITDECNATSSADAYLSDVGTSNTHTTIPQQRVAGVDDTNTCDYHSRQSTEVDTQCAPAHKLLNVVGGGDASYSGASSIRVANVSEGMKQEGKKYRERGSSAPRRKDVFPTGATGNVPPECSSSSDGEADTAGDGLKLHVLDTNSQPPNADGVASNINFAAPSTAPEMKSRGECGAGVDDSSHEVDARYPTPSFQRFVKETMSLGNAQEAISRLLLSCDGGKNSTL